MHYKEQSATGLRGAKREDTTRTLVRSARRLTAERGLAGFTVEDVCEEAGVSRRTFFNYFATKDDAVIGFSLQRSDADAVEAFLAADAGQPGTISETLLLDLVTLSEVRWRTLDIAPETIEELAAAVDREPRLHERLLTLASEAERLDARLIEQREGLPEGDLRAQVAAQIIEALCRGAAVEFLDGTSTDTFIDIFERRIGAAHHLFATQTAPMGKPE